MISAYERQLIVKAERKRIWDRLMAEGYCSGGWCEVRYERLRLVVGNLPPDTEYNGDHRSDWDQAMDDGWLERDTETVGDQPKNGPG